jgi:RHS repeat-associated protein
VNLSLSVESSTWGQPVTYTAKVSASGVSGTMAFYANGSGFYTTSFNASQASFTNSEILNPGTYSITAKWTATGITSNSENLTIYQATPTLSISNIPSSAIHGGSFAPSYTYSGNGSPTESVSSSTTNVCTVSGNTVSYVGAGTCTLTAHATATTDYTAGTGSAQSFTVSRATPTASLSCSPNTVTYVASGSGTLTTCTATVGAAGSTANVVFTYNGNAWTTVPLSGDSASASGFNPGTTAQSFTITAAYAGDNNYNPVNASTTFTISKASPTASLSCSPNPVPYVPSGSGTLTTCTAAVNAPGSVANVVFTYNGNSWTTVALSNSAAAASGFNPGTASQSFSILASYAGDSNHNAVSASTTFTISKASQSITFSAPSSPVYDGTPPISLSASASSGLGVTFSVLSGPGSVSGSTLTIADPGTVEVAANQAGNGDYSAAAQVTQSVVVNPAPKDSGTITLTVNGVTAAQASYGATSTPDTIAAGLVTGISSNSPVSLSAANGELYMTAKSSGAGSDLSYTFQTTWNQEFFNEPSFVMPPVSGTLDGGASTNTSASTIYSYSIPPYTFGSSSTGYDAVGNVLGYTDQLTGPTASGTLASTTDAWLFPYDTLNRLTGAAGSQAGPNGQTSTNYCWSYDAFGNRTLNYNGVCTSGLTLTSYNTSNQLASGLQGYDAAGDVTIDTVAGNSYLYDADGRICAVQSETADGVTVKTGYVYNAEGERVAKGPITTMSCDPVASGLQTASESDYVLGPSGEQLTEMGNGNTTWVHTNVFVAGELFATYDHDGLHFYANDWLGNRRVQTDYAGVPEQACTNLPFGDGLSCSQSVTTPTEHHFTGKERDAESGNDYFDARYYSSAMGRFMSPDWSAKEDPVPYASLDDPQSLNLYSYVRNNPLIRVDADGHCCDPDDVINFLGGAMNAFGSDNLLGAGRQQQTTAAGQVGAAVGDFTAAAVGATETLAGAGGDIVGGALDLTGVGAVAGIPINIVSTAAVIQGSAAAVEGSTHLAMGLLPKPPTGKGSVPADQRDPKRTSTAGEKSQKLSEQGGKCANCEKPVKDGDGIGHHVDRHADGGKTDSNNVPVVCKDCHKELHSGSN